MTRTLLAFVVVLLCALPVQAADYYVATTGSNAAAGTIGAPWLTPQYALATAACGDTIYLRAGTYPSVATTSSTFVTSCTSWGTPLTMRRYQSEAVHLPSIAIYSEDYLIFQDLILDGNATGNTIAVGSTCEGAWGTCAGHLRFLNLDVHGPTTQNCSYVNCGGGTITYYPGSAGFNEFIGGSLHDTDGVPAGQENDINTVHGFYNSSPSNLIDGVDIYNIDGTAILNYVAIAGPIADNNIYRNNKIHGCGKDASVNAIALYSGDGIRVYNNLIYGCANGITTSCSTVNDIDMDNNTIYGLTRSNDPAITICGGTGHALRNNIVYGNANNSIDTSGATSPTVSNNLLTDPSFVNAAANDFHLQTGSAAKNAGVTIGAITTDFDAVARPQGAAYDIGAYEFVESTSQPWPARLRTRIPG